MAASVDIQSAAKIRLRRLRVDTNCVPVGIVAADGSSIVPGAFAMVGSSDNEKYLFVNARPAVTSCNQEASLGRFSLFRHMARAVFNHRTT